MIIFCVEMFNASLLKIITNTSTCCLRAGAMYLTFFAIFVVYFTYKTLSAPNLTPRSRLLFQKFTVVQPVKFSSPL
jgi:hypothetical protein